MSTEGRPRAEGRRADLMQALRSAAEPDHETRDLITSHKVRVLIGRTPGSTLSGLGGFPQPAAFAGRTALYRREEVETWRARELERRIAPQKRREAERAARTEKERERRAARAATFRAEALSLIPLPSEFERNRSLMRDLFDEDQRTCAPAPCGHWRVLLSKAGHAADGRDVSPKVLAREREADRSRDPRTRLSLGHSPLEKPRADNLRLSAQVPEPGKQGHKPPAITLHGFVRELYAAGI